jgi:hypothetical protein
MIGRSVSAPGQTLHFHLVTLTSGFPQLADMLGGYEYYRQRSTGLATPSEWLAFGQTWSRVD